MMHLVSLATGIAALSTAAISNARAIEANEPTTYHVYFLAGQSNMDGYGFESELGDEWNVEGDAFIFHGKNVADGEEGGGVGLWAPLQVGHGTGFDTDGLRNQRSDRFGPELSFAEQLAGKHGEQRIAIIKYARGGTGLIHGVSGYGSWDPEYREGNRRNQYDNALSTIDAAMSVRDIDGDGVEDRLIPAGIVWMQGEADAFDNEAAAANYEANLRRIMTLFRAAFRDDDLPVVIGQIADSGQQTGNPVMTYADEVKAGQAAFVNADPCAALVTVTSEFKFLPDLWHYESSDYLTLGRAFAEALNTIADDCQPDGMGEVQ